MRRDKTMYFSIGIVLVIFTLIQVFYFASIEIVPRGVISTKTLIEIGIVITEFIVLFILAMVITYILPLVCIIKWELFVSIRRIEVSETVTKKISCVHTTRYQLNTYLKLNVIRC